MNRSMKKSLCVIYFTACRLGENERTILYWENSFDHLYILGECPAFRGKNNEQYHLLKRRTSPGRNIQLSKSKAGKKPQYTKNTWLKTRRKESNYLLFIRLNGDRFWQINGKANLKLKRIICQTHGNHI